MSISSHSGHFFQSSSSLETQSRRARKRTELKDNGTPITLQTKVLSILPDPTSLTHLFVAEASNVARRIDLQNPSKPSVAVFRGHTAPVACLALNTDATILYTGSWDKKLLAFRTTTQQILTKFDGHNDFIKDVIYTDILPTKPMLISASADYTIMVWDPTSGKRLHTLKGHLRGVNCLVIDTSASTREAVVLYSGGSNREIKRWVITAKSAKEDVDGEIIAHETSLNAIRFLGEEEEDTDMWTASSDTLAKRFDRHELSMPRSGDGESVKSDSEFKHPDFVNDVVLDRTRQWAITACSDEEVRVWDIGSGKLYHTFSGHYDVVNRLVVIGDTLFSSSLDSTIRRWSLKSSDLKIAIEVEKRKQEAIQSGVVEHAATEKKNEDTLLTEEEERELAELMDDSD